MYSNKQLYVTGDISPCTDDPVLWSNGTLPRCPQANWVVPALLAIYILITNVLMLNLLIAMFRWVVIYIMSPYC